jgi:hypothetical protein
MELPVAGYRAPRGHNTYFPFHLTKIALFFFPLPTMGHALWVDVTYNTNCQHGLTHLPCTCP